MIFATEGAIHKIISGEKSQTRRLIKEGEQESYFCQNFYLSNTSEHNVFAVKGTISIVYNTTELKRKRWQVGKTYSVQMGRNKPGIWYDTETKVVHHNFPAGEPLAKKFKGLKEEWKKHYPNVIPLRIRITAIRKEKLLDITEEDAKKEGFKSKLDFLRAFCLINGKRSQSANEPMWNPEVWVLEFCVVKP
jgi:hypothetical protein